MGIYSINMLFIPQKSTHNFSNPSFFYLNSTGAATQVFTNWMNPLARFLSMKSLNSPISFKVIEYILGLGSFALARFQLRSPWGNGGGHQILSH